MHGAPLGADDIAATKKRFGFDPERHFYVPDEVKRQYAGVRERGEQLEADWNALFGRYEAAFPQLAAELKRRIHGQFPANWVDNLPRYTPDAPAVATRYVSYL